MEALYTLDGYVITKREPTGAPHAGVDSGRLFINDAQTGVMAWWSMGRGFAAILQVFCRYKSGNGCLVSVCLYPSFVRGSMRSFLSRATGQNRHCKKYHMLPTHNA